MMIPLLFLLSIPAQFNVDQVLIYSQQRELLKKTEEQIQELRKFVASNQATAAQLARAAALTEKLTEGIDEVLKPLKNSREYQVALLEYQEKQKVKAPSDMDRLKQFLPEVAQDEEKRTNDLRVFQQNVVGANKADLKDVETMEQRLQEAKPGELARMNTQAVGKIWESNLRLSIQLSELLTEIRGLRQEVALPRINDQIDTAQQGSAMRDSLKGLFGRTQ